MRKGRQVCEIFSTMNYTNSYVEHWMHSNLRRCFASRSFSILRRNERLAVVQGRLINHHNTCKCSPNLVAWPSQREVWGALASGILVETRNHTVCPSSGALRNATDRAPVKLCQPSRHCFSTEQKSIKKVSNKQAKAKPWLIRRCPILLLKTGMGLSPMSAPR